MYTYVLSFIFGTFIGSFLNVLIERLPRGQNPLTGRSKCDHCQHALSPLDLIPIISYLLLFGRCRYCRSKLSLQYPLVEIATGFMFAGLFYYAFSLNRLPFYGYVCLLLIFSSFLVIFFIDWKNQIIPDELVISSLIGVLLLQFLAPDAWSEKILSAISATLFLYLLYVFTRGRGMGLGDVKLMFVLGLMLGFPDVVIGLYLAFLTGALLSLILIAVGIKKWRDRIAFGPFLIWGATIAYFGGENLSRWYFLLIS